MTPKTILAALAGFVVMFGLAGFFHLAIFADFFAQKAGTASSLMYPVLSYIILACLMAYIYPHGYKGGSFVTEGFKFGLLMGLMARLPFEVLQLGYGRGDWTFVIVEAVWHAIEQGIGGIVIAYVYGKTAATTSTA